MVTDKAESVRLIALLLLTGCISVPPVQLSPADCRAYGVNVADHATPTGTIVASHHGSMGLMYRECGEGAAGCAKGVEGTWPSASHRYEIYYTNGCDAYHEMAHALYETTAHTICFNLAWMCGDIFASCP